jgi:hypothetical protein
LTPITHLIPTVREAADVKSAATKRDLDELRFAAKLDLATVKSEITILEKSDFAQLRAEVHQVSSKLQSETLELHTAIERQKNDLIRYVLGGIGTGFMIFLGFKRLEK